MRALEFRTLFSGEGGYEVEVLSPSDLYIKVLAKIIPLLMKVHVT